LLVHSQQQVNRLSWKQLWKASADEISEKSRSHVVVVFFIYLPDRTNYLFGASVSLDLENIHILLMEPEAQKHDETRVAYRAYDRLRLNCLGSLDLSADNTAKKQRGRPFDPGQSGRSVGKSRVQNPLTTKGSHCS
jgi:hypothetical protein